MVEEVKLTVTRWKESDEEEELRLGLIEQWFLVRGVPRTYRNWDELYCTRLLPRFGVLVGVDEESLGAGG